MTATKARQLLVGTVVMNGDLTDLGTVRLLGPGGFFVDWESGRRGWIDYIAAKCIALV